MSIFADDVDICGLFFIDDISAGCLGAMGEITTDLSIAKA
jgi:hypothetical protein